MFFGVSNPAIGLGRPCSAAKGRVRRLSKDRVRRPESRVRWPRTVLGLIRTVFGALINSRVRRLMAVFDGFIKTVFGALKAVFGG